MTQHNRQFDNPEPHIPDRLRQDLQGLFQPSGPVPARVDKAILDQAHRRLVKPRRLVIRLRWAAGIATAAAVITLGAVLFNPQSAIKNPQSSRPALAEGRADVDGNGRVDILDAFRLARNIEARGPADPRWDLNGDGRVDKDDVDVVAAAAVRLGSELQAHRGEGVPPLRRETIPSTPLRASLASLFSRYGAPVTPDMQGQDALAASLSGSPRANGV
jgi:hypothetical protein